MQITRFNYEYISKLEVISVKVILDTDRIKEKVKGFDLNKFVDGKVDGLVGVIVDLFG